jgi:hypothetical protein
MILILFDFECYNKFKFNYSFSNSDWMVIEFRFFKRFSINFISDSVCYFRPATESDDYVASL